MFKHILVPLDGSARAEQALPVAARLARFSNGTITLLQVASSLIDYYGPLTEIQFITEQSIEECMAEAESYLAALASSTELAGIKIKIETTYGLPAQNILNLAQTRHCDIIVICSHGRTDFKRWALGSITQQVVHHCSVPVLVLREDHSLLKPAQTHAARSISALAPLDGSQLAEAALVPAANLVAALAAPGRGSLHLTRVVKLFPASIAEGHASELNREALEQAKTYLASMQEHLPEIVKDLKLTISWSAALNADVADALIGTAEDEKNGAGARDRSGCDLIVMSTHGRSGFERWMIGSVTERVLSASRLPILIVRPQKVKQTEPV